MKLKLQQTQQKIKTHQTLLSTQSPQGIAAASAITPNRLANLLIQTGPLPIRYITKHLSDQIPDFALLSLSKQRRLIMAALEMGDEETGCVFEKIGWGQWATKKISSAEIIEYNHNKLKQQQQQQQSQSQSQSQQVPHRTTSLSSSPPIRRQSITNPHTDPHNLKMPYNPSLAVEEAVLESSSSMNSSDSDDEHAVMDDDDDDEEDDDVNLADHDDNYDDEDSDGALFKLDSNNRNNSHSNGNVRFSSRVLNSLNHQHQQQSSNSATPPPASQRRSFSSLNNGSQEKLLIQPPQQRRGSSSSYGIRKPRTKSRLNSFDYYEAKYDNQTQTIDGVLDAAAVPDSILMIRKKPRSSFSESYLRSTPTPSSIKVMSSDENLPASVPTTTTTTTTYTPHSSSSPPKTSSASVAHPVPVIANPTTTTNPTTIKNEDPSPPPTAAHPDTDEEDWQSIGADKLSAAYALLMIKKKEE